MVSGIKKNFFLKNIKHFYMQHSNLESVICLIPIPFPKH